MSPIAHPNVRAFVWALRYGEGTQGDDGFRTLFGGKLFVGKDGKYGTFDDFADHPRIRVTMKLRSGGTRTSTAAGAGQFLERTWDGLVEQYGFEDFSPPNQELGMIKLIEGRKALDDVINGRIDVAVAKCNKEWASLPGSPYGQPVVTMAQFKQQYEAAGGTYTGVELPSASVLAATPLPEPALPPVEDRVPVPVEVIRQQASSEPLDAILEKPMLPVFAQALLPSLVNLVPQLVKIFGSGSEVSDRNAKAVDAVMQVAKDAIGARNEQEVLESIKADPTQAQLVKQAIEDNFLQIVEAGGGGIAGARDFNVQMATLRDADGHAISLFKQPAFVVTLLLLFMVFFTMVVVMTPWELWTEGGRQIFSDEVRLIVVTAMITGTLSAIVAFWLGSSFSSKQKDNTISALGTRVSDR